MPTYEYQCPSCRHEFEVMQAITAKPLKKCPQCGRKVQRLLGSGMGVIFKGSGFYETDYKRKTSPSIKKESAKSDGPADSKKAASKPTDPKPPPSNKTKDKDAS